MAVGPLAVIARKYNPGFLSADELVATFCVRTAEFESLIEALRECSGSANTHQIVIGPRGSGKTSLLLRVSSEVSRDADLSARFFPVVFAEESYEVSTAGEFWLECVSRLADQTPRQAGDVDLQRTFEELRTVHDDRTLEGRCLGVLQDFADREEKRLVLIVENLNMMFRDMGDDDAGWRLRKVLQTEARIILLASATSRFDQIDDPREAFYELFRMARLHPLDTEDCAILWRTVSGQARAPQTIQALRILTGGNPRLLTIVARFGANLSFRELMADLLDLVDDHTEYFKSHLDALPAQERRVYLALAKLWKPANAREIADRARLGTNKCSAQLTRLIDKGAVEVSGGSARRKLYYLTERLYNIYYLMRRARGPAPLVDALIRFMEAYYSTDEMREFVTRMAHEALGSDGGALALYRLALARLVELPSLEEHREELRSLASPAFAYALSESSDASSAPLATTELIGKAMALAKEGRWQDAVAAWDEVVQRFGKSDAPAGREQVATALVSKGNMLNELERYTEAVEAYDEVLERFGKSDSPELRFGVAVAMFRRGDAFRALNRFDEAIDAWEAGVERFGADNAEGFSQVESFAFVNIGEMLFLSGRLKEALTAFDRAVQSYTANDEPIYGDLMARCFFNRGKVLAGLKRETEALSSWETVIEIWHDVVPRYESGEEPCGHDRSGPVAIEMAAQALVNKGALLVTLDRTEEGLAAWDEVIRRLETDDVPALRDVAELALRMRAQHELAEGRPRDAVAFLDRALLQTRAGRPNSRLQGHLIRARAHLAEGDGEACVGDVETALSILSELSTFPREVLVTLADLAAGVGPERMCHLIESSPAGDLLLPLRTALERELGLEPRVSREVEEVAEDIRRELLVRPNR